MVSLSDELRSLLLHIDVRVLTNYYQGIRIYYHKLLERARNLHLSYNLKKTVTLAYLEIFVKISAWCCLQKFAYKIKRVKLLVNS